MGVAKQWEVHVFFYNNDEVEEKAFRCSYLFPFEASLRADTSLVF